jgi:hypothetical protein
LWDVRRSRDKAQRRRKLFILVMKVMSRDPTLHSDMILSTV